MTGQTANGQRAKLREVTIPLHFSRAKAPTSAVFIELVAPEDGSADEQFRSINDCVLMVSGKDGSMRLPSNRKTSVTPAFLQPEPETAEEPADGESGPPTIAYRTPESMVEEEVKDATGLQSETPPAPSVRVAGRKPVRLVRKKQ